MLLFHENRMGLSSLPSSSYCRAPLWAAPPSTWFAPHHPLHPLPMAAKDTADPWKSPQSPQSDTDSSLSSTDTRLESPSQSTAVTIKSSATSTTCEDQDVPTHCLWKGCGKSFGQLDNLSSHVASEHTTIQDGMFYCGWEGCQRGHKGFNARYKMLVHVRTHTKERPHSCPVCGKSFSRAENLKIHARSHSGEKPYVCTVPGCGKAYSNSSDRFKHTRTHMVDKPYFCKVPGCQKRYTDPSSLRKHVKTFKHITVDNANINQEAKSYNENKDNIEQSLYKNFDKSISLHKEQNVERIENQNRYDYLSSRHYEYDLKSSTKSIEYKSTSELENNLDNNTKSYDIVMGEIDPRKEYCYCKDLPCVHTNSYIEQEYISVDHLSYNKLEERSIYYPPNEISTPFLDVPLNLKRKCYKDEYNGAVINLEKRTKTDYRSLIEDCLEKPLDLSRKRYY